MTTKYISYTMSYKGAGALSSKGDFVTGFLFHEVRKDRAERRRKPRHNTVPCASSFAIETGSLDNPFTASHSSSDAPERQPSGSFRPVRRGPPGNPHPHPDGKTPSGALVRRGSSERPVPAYLIQSGRKGVIRCRWDLIY